MKYKSLAMALLLISTFLSLSYLSSFFSSVLVFGEESKVVISPDCGSAKGFNININANGFSPNSSVSWVMFDPKVVPVINGYFATNSTGGFNEFTHVDFPHVNDVLLGEYAILFFDDSDLNYKMDNEENIYQVSLMNSC